MFEQQLQAKFHRLDTGAKGYIDEDDITIAFSSQRQRYPSAGARMLIRLFSQSSNLNFQQFCKLNQFVAQQVQVFRQFQANGRLNDDQFCQALQSLSFDLNMDVVQSLKTMALQVFQTNVMGVLEFQYISVFLHLAGQLF